MKHALVFVSMVAAATLDLAVTPPPVGADNFSIGVNIGAPLPPPPPPMVLVAPPPMVVVPGTPVYYAPSLSANFFAYGGRYYTHHNGAWFTTANYSGPWSFIAVERVPRPVLTVPVAYYKAPPGHMKRGGPPPWTGHRKGHRHKERDEDD
ncbi:MAG: hypothetical protein C3F08_01145 [Candidatus Methylomirabilota bacterium]|nr:MAG: hypothetical protein C3F08_01145 [candidate division NC10 bacterium]